MKHYLCHQKDPGKWQVGCAVQPHRPPSLGDLLPSSLDAQYPRFLFWYNDTCVFLLDEVRVRCRPNRMG